MKKIIINLGCGQTRIPNSIGVDRLKIKTYVDIVHDLDLLPYPFKSNFADEIHMYHVLEHLHDPLKKLEEIHRILKPGGILYLRVPHFSSLGAFSDISHVRPFGYTTFDCFDRKNEHHFYTKKEFIILEKEIKYFGRYPNRGLYAHYIHQNKCSLFLKPFVHLINFLIKISPEFFERVWCYWVGGAMEIAISFKKINGK